MYNLTQPKHLQLDNQEISTTIANVVSNKNHFPRKGRMRRTIILFLQSVITCLNISRECRMARGDGSASVIKEIIRNSLEGTISRIRNVAQARIYLSVRQICRSTFQRERERERSSVAPREINYTEDISTENSALSGDLARRFRRRRFEGGRGN